METLLFDYGCQLPEQDLKVVHGCFERICNSQLIWSLIIMLINYILVKKGWLLQSLQGKGVSDMSQNKTLGLNWMRRQWQTHNQLEK